MDNVSKKGDLKDECPALLEAQKHDTWQESIRNNPNGGASTYLEVYFTFEEAPWGITH
jgi:hypothetical protein